MEGRLISDDLASAINGQIGHEFGASLQYVQIAAYFESQNLTMLGKIFYEQSTEERMHAMKLVDYVVRTGAQLEIPTIPAPKADFVNAEEAVRLALTWEMEVAKQFGDLMDVAVSENDYLAQDFFTWFVTEQLEEVVKMRRILDVVMRAGSNLLMVEAYLSHGQEQSPALTA